MNKKFFHVCNIVFLLLLLAFNALALFGAGMSDGGVYAYMWFVTGVAFASWIIFYIVQFVRPSKVWRISWFLIMVIFLFFWESGLGVQVGLMIYP